MLAGRFFLIVPVLAIAGSLARKQTVPPSAGTFPTHSPLFVVMLLAVIVIVVGLTYFPVLALGPDRGAAGAMTRKPLGDRSIAGSCAGRRGDAVRQARSAPHGAQPGHVRGRGRPACS